MNPTPQPQMENIVETLLASLEQALTQNLSLGARVKAQQMLSRLDISQVSEITDDKISTRVLDYVSEHYLEPLTLETIAQKFHRAPAHLTTRFRKATGLPVMECVLEKRMDEAKHLLATTSQTVQKIADHIGYTDVSLFSRQFRRRFGVSPRQWRDKKQGEKKANFSENEAILNITIIGTGNMARGIGSRFVSGGHDITFVSRNPEAAQALVNELVQLRPGAKVTAKTLGESVQDDVVVLAVPYQVGLELAQNLGSQLDGKIVVDMANALNATYSGLVTEPGTSAAEELVAVLPKGAKVVKAFNTIFAGTLASGKVAGQPLDVFIAGNDEPANEVVAGLVKDGGLNPVKVGGLERSRELEAMLMLGIAAQQPLGYGFNSAWRLVGPA
jgi:8-hydroxy-5-deazaflavin:NADPH oxidoreductase